MTRNQGYHYRVRPRSLVSMMPAADEPSMDVVERLRRMARRMRPRSV